MAMMTALTTAVSGMKTEQTALDTIANNIANVNTIGYKAQTVSFSDLLSQTIKNAEAGTSSTGSVNAQQTGMGVQVASTTTDTSTGSTESTSSSLDVALTGSGYLVVLASDGTYEYTRDGEISIDDSGNLNINGYEVCGWETYTTNSDGTKVYDTTTSPTAINVFSDSTGSKTTLAATETTVATLTGNLNSADTAVGTALQNIGSTSSLTADANSTVKVYDSEGNETDVSVKFYKCATQNGITSWYWAASATDTSISPSNGYIAFDSSGNIVTNPTVLTSTYTDDTTAAGYSASDITLSSDVAAGDYTVTVAAGSTTGTYTISLTDSSGTAVGSSVTSSDGSAVFTTSAGATITLAAPTTITAGSGKIAVTSATASFPDTLKMTVSSSTYGTGGTAVSLDLSGIASKSTDDSVTATEDGNAAGSSSGTYSINSDGTISVSYTCGTKSVTQTVGQLALASFTNAGGLEKVGGNLYTSSSSSGDASYVVAGNGGTGTLSSSALELSNVDLASQFSSMMISQRAYQANSKVISTSDTMLQSLISMVS